MDVSAPSEPSVAAQLVARLRAEAPEGMLDQAAVALGRLPDEIEDARITTLLGFFLTVGEQVSSLYLVSDRLFAACQVSVDGALLQVSVPLDRVRRVAALADAIALRLTVELEADRSSATTQLLPSGESYSVQVPAGYELLAATEDEVRQLRSFHLALARSL